jgi:hypothetical protein
VEGRRAAGGGRGEEGRRGGDQSSEQGSWVAGTPARAPSLSPSTLSHAEIARHLRSQALEYGRVW